MRIPELAEILMMDFSMRKSESFCNGISAIFWEKCSLISTQFNYCPGINSNQ